jgi:alkanesulfonate monooxygenase SsuD/methylene tetrahydromethanopterin reductase-like flavin-dependent oxidoreductase (luciferase family)
MMAWPKPVQKPYPPVLIGGAFPYSARRAVRYGDGWMPQATAKDPTPLTKLIPRFRQMAAEAGRDPAAMQVMMGAQPPDAALAGRYQALGVDVMYPSLPSEGADTVLPLLDVWVGVMRAVNG